MFTADWYMHDMGTGTWLLMTLFWALVVGLIVWAVLAQLRDAEGRRPERTAREILDERLARGEISVEEHQRRRDALERDRTPQPPTPVVP